MTEALLVLRGLEEMYPEERFIENLREAVEKQPHENWGDFMSRGQVRSKKWALHELRRANRRHLGRVVVCGGWYGMLPRMIYDNPHITAESVACLDQDPGACIAASTINQDLVEYGFTVVATDVLNFSYLFYNTVFNTSCEHMSPGTLHMWRKLISPGALVVAQSNDFTEPEDHINTVGSEQELAEQLELSEVLFMGKMPLYKYTRYMVIGES